MFTSRKSRNRINKVKNESNKNQKVKHRVIRSTFLPAKYNSAL